MRYLPCLLAFLLASPSWAGSKLVATGGTSSIEGTSGGGIVPWATIGGYGSSDEWAATVNWSRVGVKDFSLVSQSFGLSYDDRYELTLARQSFWISPMQQSLEQQIVGFKVRVAGHLIYDALPQISIGTQWKDHQRFGLPKAVGAMDANGQDWYLSASKVYLDALFGRNLLLNTTVRWTKANQAGLLGFGAVDHQNYQPMLEASAALLVRHDVAIGAEFRQKPNQLAFAREDHWRDLFAAWFINQQLSVVGGYVDLGDIAGLRNQQGYYLAIQGVF